MKISARHETIVGTLHESVFGNCQEQALTLPTYRRTPPSIYEVAV
jgi:hypothetical protein